MKNILLLALSLTLCFNVCAQIPSTTAKIQSYIDSIGKSNDRRLVSASMFPAFANGHNFEWRTNMWTNKKHKLLWVEHIIPDSISRVFFYCKDSLIFASERTYDTKSAPGIKKNIFRNIFFYQARIIEDTMPGNNNNTAAFYINESRKYLRLSKNTK
ncbi:hypothetical protein [Hymenobacter properus]|uniref:Uncharacterized protein n=1 Tax=Hymenobacter properus TaxID=2791026 RepID=A0A931BB12_9BACT|nr:hypothetical protein [Hymenobacter properus]MBF9140454.1 hypothetical protein [Hymenobacter properus]MBR7719261.1 hypothetical protein [Microvirga sp. SRT04]